jgi:hypothetical protein
MSSSARRRDLGFVLGEVEHGIELRLRTTDS